MYSVRLLGILLSSFSTVLNAASKKYNVNVHVHGVMYALGAYSFPLWCDICFDVHETTQ